MNIKFDDATVQAAIIGGIALVVVAVIGIMSGFFSYVAKAVLSIVAKRRERSSRLTDEGRRILVQRVETLTDFFGLPRDQLEAVFAWNHSPAALITRLEKASDFTEWIASNKATFATSPGNIYGNLEVLATYTQLLADLASRDMTEQYKEYDKIVAEKDAIVAKLHAYLKSLEKELGI